MIVGHEEGPAKALLLAGGVELLDCEEEQHTLAS